MGHPEEAPYDAIHVGAAAPTVPQAVCVLRITNTLCTLNRNFNHPDIKILSSFIRPASETCSGFGLFLSLEHNFIYKSSTSKNIFVCVPQ